MSKPTCPAHSMQAIIPATLTHLPTRVQYLRDFIQFTHEDAATLHSAKAAIAPLVPLVIDEVYTTLLSFDITAKAFVPRQTGYKGAAPTKLGELGHDHPQIKYRKDFLTRYIVKLVTMNYETNESWEYLDKVGLMHTGAAGFAHRAKRPGLRVEYMHCAILLGFVEDILLKAVMALPDLDLDAKTQLVRSFNKILWIQNDLFARHYIADQEVGAAKISFEKSTVALLGLGLLSLGAGIARYLLPC